MKKINLFIANVLMLFFLFSMSNAKMPEVNEDENISAFIKVWGLIKYKSPVSIAGQFNADQIFTDYFDKIRNANKTEFNEMLLELMDKNEVMIGANDSEKFNCKDCLTKNESYKWINDSQFSAQIRSKLLMLSKTLNTTDNHHYINKVSYESEIKNEASNLAYQTFKNPVINLLALAKSWCAIEYLFPYKYKMDKDHHKNLREMITVFKAINSRASYEIALLKLETSIDDTHAAIFLNQLKSKAEIFKISHYPPFDYQCFKAGIVIKNFLSDTLEKQSSLKKGDVIVEINNVKIADWLKERMELLPASNLSVKYRLLSSDWQGNTYAFYNCNDDVLAVKVNRQGKLLSLKLNMLNLRTPGVVNIINTYIKKQVALDEQVKPLTHIGNDIVLIKGGYFLDKDLPQNEAEEILFSKELQSKKAIIFDMRKYPSGGLFYYFIPMALGKTSIEFAKYYQSNIQNPSTFIKVEGKEIYLSKDLKQDKRLYEGKIIILTNEHTQSKGEWFTMMLSQLNRHTTIIGSETAGTDGDYKLLNLPGGYKFVFTGNGIFYPNGAETQRVGIKPDILFKPTAKDLSSSEDAHLARAIQFINSGK